MFPQWQGYEPLEKTSGQSHAPYYYLQEAACYAIHKLSSVPRSFSRLASQRIIPLWARHRDHTCHYDCPTYHLPFSATYRLRRLFRRLCVLVAILPQIIFLILLTYAILFPSYTRAPAHYGVLRQRASNSSVAGRANPSNEKVFIVSSIYDPNGALTGGAWGQTVLDLIDILGPTNVFLSVYENDPSELAEASLDDFRRAVHCNASVISEHISMDSLPKATLPSGEERVRRIAFLAEVRNRALRPLDDENSPASKTQFDKLLFLNDVIFNPVEAAQLLFSTNVDAAGKADYRAACAVDFINPFKFYDTYATRDLEGYGVGLPFYPWFSSEGDAASRRDVLAQKDAVRVRSCWGGMVAFDAKWFQQIPRPSKSAISTTTSKTPLRFTYDHELYWDSSECCLINAQLQTLDPSSLADSETGIFMNPFVRVAYDENTFRWLPLVRRIERTFSWIHGVLTSIIGVRFNYRRTEEPGDAVSHYEWDPANDASKKSSFEMRNDMDSVSGNWKLVQTTAGVGGFCGIEQMLLLGDGEDGHPRWENAWMPEKPLLARLPVPQI